MYSIQVNKDMPKAISDLVLWGPSLGLLGLGHLTGMGGVAAVLAACSRSFYLLHLGVGRGQASAGRSRSGQAGSYPPTPEINPELTGSFGKALEPGQEWAPEL